MSQEHNEGQSSTAQVSNCGASGNNVTGTLIGETLTIRGNGAMRDYNNFEETSAWRDSFEGDISKVVIDDGVTYIGMRAFDGWCVESVIISGSVASIGQWAFGDCMFLTSVIIHNGVTFIENGAFSDCYSLTSVTIPASVTSIESWSFHECTSLRSVFCLNPVPPAIGDSAFGEVGEIIPIDLYVPKKSIGDYKSDPSWKRFPMFVIKALEESEEWKKE